MRRTIIGFMSTVSALVLLFSYHTSTNSEAAAAGVVSATASTSSSRTSVTGAASASTGSLAATSSGTTASPATTAPTTTTSTTSSAAVSSGKSSGKSSGTYTGDAVNTRWGLVQVEITVDNGTITAAQAVQYPNENGQDREINSYAVPKLNSEVTAAQSGSIDAVSGATVTSNGYITSLQSAIDKANL